MHAVTLALVGLLQAATPAPQNMPTPAPEQLADAEARYRSAIALNPAIAAYHESLALVLERKGALTEALAEHERAVALDSLTVRNRLGLGRLLVRLQRPHDAVVHLRAAVAADRQSVPTWLELSQALVADGQEAEAAAALDSARAIAPNDASVAAAAMARRQATNTEGYHDLSGFTDDERSQRWLRVAMERVIAVVLGGAALALIAPILGAMLAILLEVPRQWLARRAA